jgi:hypothetical protein
MQTATNRIIEITPRGIIDKMLPFDEYLASDEIRAQREEMYLQPV